MQALTPRTPNRTQGQRGCHDAFSGTAFRVFRNQDRPVLIGADDDECRGTLAEDRPSVSTAPTSVLRVSIPGLSALSPFLLNLCFMSMVPVGSFYASFHLCPLPGDREATLAISCTCLAQVLVFHLHVSYLLSSPMVPQLLSHLFVDGPFCSATETGTHRLF